MPLKTSSAIIAENVPQIAQDALCAKQPQVKSYADTKDARILYQGLAQAALQSMPLGQFAPDVETHLKNVMATVDALAVFILDRSK